MRKNWLLIGIGLLTAVLAIGAIACDDDEDGEATATATAEEAETPEATAEEGETPDLGAKIADIILAALEGSGVTGSATITESETGDTEVVVTIDGGLEEGTHANHIHGGSCDDVGGIAASLTDLEAGADGSASGTTTIVGNPDAEVGHLAEGGHVVAIHALDGSIVACGPVEAGS